MIRLDLSWKYQKVIIDNFVGKIIETDEDDAWIAFKLDVTVPSDYEKGAIDLRVYYQGIDSDGFEIQFGFMNGKVTRGARRTLTSKDMFSRKDLKRIVAWKISD